MKTPSEVDKIALETTMTDNSTIAIIASIAVPVIGLFVSTIVKFYKSEKELQRQIHKLEIKMKDLEKKDEVQQAALDHLTDIFHIFNKNPKWSKQ